LFAIGSELNQYGWEILHSIDAGKTWTKQTSADAPDLNAVWGSGKDDVYAVGDGGAILHSTDSGKTWATQTSDLGAIHAIWGSGKDDIFLESDAYQISHSTDSGRTWPFLNIGSSYTYYNMQAVWGSGKDVFAVGIDSPKGLILHSSD